MVSYQFSSLSKRPSHTRQAEYGNGGANSLGRYEYIWLPTDSGDAIPMGLYKSGKFFAVHSDHLGTPRLITDETNTPIWQWPYSAFGESSPTGVLAYTSNSNLIYTQDPTSLNRLKLTTPGVVYNLRHDGQYVDSETGLFYNYFRTYDPKTGRYTQNDPIGLDGGWNKFVYVENYPLGLIDPEGLQARPGPRTGPGAQPMFPRIGPTLPPANPQVGNTRSPIEVRPGTNSPGEFGGMPFSGHAFDRTQGRGIPPSVVTNTVLTGRPSPGSRPNTTQYHDPINNVTVVVNSTTGNIITIRNGPPSNTCSP